MTGVPLDASHLAQAKKGTAQDAYMGAMFGLVGLPIPAAWYREVIAAFMDGFRRGAEEAGKSWETTRVDWNQQHPGSRFDGGDAMRKTIERARENRRSK